jgi:SAGA-associated factor 29
LRNTKRGFHLIVIDGSILSKAKEKLEILAALRQATETYGMFLFGSYLGEQKRKRKDAPADIQPSKTKKPRMYWPFDSPDPSDEIRVGSKVAYHLPKAKQSDAEWIQCNVVRVTGEHPKLRYEVQDPEPDEQGNTSQTYKTTAQSLILIPEDSTGLAPYPNGTEVLARYPETTTFYKAEVISTKVYCIRELLMPREMERVNYVSSLVLELK